MCIYSKGHAFKVLSFCRAFLSKAKHLGVCRWTSTHLHCAESLPPKQPPPPLNVRANVLVVLDASRVNATMPLLTGWAFMFKSTIMVLCYYLFSPHTASQPKNPLCLELTQETRRRINEPVAFTVIITVDTRFFWSYVTERAYTSFQSTA